MSEKIDFESKVVRGDTEGPYTDKGSIHQKAVTVVNIYALVIRAPKYIKAFFNRSEGKKQQYSNSRRLLSIVESGVLIIQTEYQ